MEQNLLAVDKYRETVVSMAINYAPQLVLALATLVAGLWAIKVVVAGAQAAFARTGMEATLQKFLLSLINIGLKGLLIISVASMVGIETTSFIAVLGAAGLAVGLALQGSLANFAGGVLILLFKPLQGRRLY
jgi:small conductance mechanosensitive channel